MRRFSPMTSRRFAALALAALATMAAGITPAKAYNLTLACLDIGRVVEACNAAARRFEAQSGHIVRVVGADATGRYALERYSAIFDVTSGRIDVLQFPDSWVPALGPDLSTLPEPEEGEYVPALLDAGRDAGRLVGLPEHIAITLLFLRSDVIQGDPKAWSQLRESLLLAPSDGALGLALGGAGPTLFPLFLDWIYSFGATALDDREQLLRALSVMNNAVGTITSPSMVTTSPQEAIVDFTNGNAAALVARSTALSQVRGSPVAQNIAAVMRPQATNAPPQTPMMVTTWFAGVSRHSRDQDAAQSLARFLTSEDEQCRAALDFGVAPARPALYDSADIQAIGPGFQRIGQHLNVMVPPPIARYGLAYLDLADDVADAVRAMLSGEAEPEATADTIVRAVRRASLAVN